MSETLRGITLKDAPADVAPVGETRLRRIAGQLQVSSDGGAYTGVGGGGGAIVTDSTLTGNGSGGSPLGVNPAAARAPDWFGALKTFFQQQTGLSPLAWGPAVEQDFGDSGLSVSQQGFQSAGTGALVVYLSLPGGVIKATGPTSGGGYADFVAAPQGQSPWNIVGNARLKRWMAAYRVAIGKTPSAGSAISCGVVFNGSTYVGLGYAGAATNWQYVRGTPTPANISDTGKAIAVDSTGATGYLTMLVGNFDLSNISYCVDAVSNLALTTAEAVTNIPSAGGSPYLFNEGAGAGDIYFLDKVLICVEL